MALAWAVVVHTKFWRLLKQEEEGYSKGTCYDKAVHFIQDTLCMFLWRFCTIGSRVIVLALAFRLGLQCFSHSILYGSIITISAILFVVAMGNVLAPHESIFFVLFNTLDYINVELVEGFTTRKRAILYYCVEFILQFLMVIIWYVMIPIKNDHSVTVLLCLASLLFIMGIMFMACHYTCCHEHKAYIKKRVKEKIKKWSWFQCNEFLSYPIYYINDNVLDHYENIQLGSRSIKWRVIPFIVLELVSLVVAVIVRLVLPWHS